MMDMSMDKSMQFNETLAMQANNLTLYNLEPEDILTAQKDTVGQLKAAFLFHAKGQPVSWAYVSHVSEF